jgi:GT2 family glycosyltransferase
MDPQYFVYSDDVDFMYRAAKSGIVMKYLPDVTMKHKVSSLTGGSATQFAMHYCTRNRIYFTRKHFSGPRGALLIFFYRSYLLLRYLVGKDPRREWEWKRNAAVEGMKMRINKATGLRHFPAR